jgi:stress-induced morphogen
MRKKLEEKYKPTLLEVMNEGDKYKVVVESEYFRGKSTLQKHRDVNECLKEEIAKIHAFSVEAKPPKA